MLTGANRTMLLLPLGGALAPDSLISALAGTALFVLIVQQLLPQRRPDARVRAPIACAACMVVGYVAACGAGTSGAAPTASPAGESENGVDVAILDRSRTLSFPSIVFEPGSTTLSDAARDDLTALAQQLSTTEKAVLQLTVHSGSEAGELGEQRVHAIEDFLVGIGVESSRIQSTKSREGIQ